MNLTKSVRGLATDINAAPQYDPNDDRFDTIFDLLDKDKNGTLSKEEAYTLVRLFELEKTKTKSLKHYLGLVAGVSALVILLLGACTFGAVFVAVKATMDTQVSTSGALMNKEGSRMLSTVAQGTRFRLFNTSEDTPLCIEGETFDIIQSDVLQGSKVILDVEEEGLDKRTILSLDAATEISSSGITCFRSLDGKEHCFADAEPADTTATVNKLAEEGKKYVVTNGDIIKAASMINSMTAIELGPVYQASVDRTNNAMKQANVAPAALAGIEAGSKIAAKRLMAGAYEVAQAGVWLAEWVEAWQCEIGMNLLLGALFATTIVDPFPYGVAVATAHLTGVAIAYKAAPLTTGKEVLGGACDIAAEYFLEVLWSSTSVVSAVGEDNKNALLDSISMTVCKNLKKAPDAFVSGWSGAAIVAGVTISEATQLACYRKLPQGTKEWGDLKVYTYHYTWTNLADSWSKGVGGAYTWSYAENQCKLHSSGSYGGAVDLCPRSVYCPNGPLQPPREGMRTANSWAPIGGEGENKWINIGNQNSATELCKEHNELGYGYPEWGKSTQKNIDNGFPFKNVIYCCRVTDAELVAADWGEPRPNTPTFSPITSNPTTLKWHFAPKWQPKCDYGSPAPQNECEAAVAALAIAAGKSPPATGSLQIGSNSGGCNSGGWNAVPLGCSAQTGGSWIAHYKKSGGDCNEGAKYQVVCSDA